MKKHLLFAAMLMLSAAPAVAAPAASAPYFAADEAPEDVATQLVNDITEAIAAWEKQIAQGKVDFPDYDWESAQEFVVDYWAGVKKNLTENPSSYTKADLADLVDEFSEAKKQNFLVIAQCEIWSGDYNAKYFPVYQKISNARVTLSEECPSVAETYIPQLDELDGEMGSALMKLSEGEVESQEEFDKMLARVDEISTEVDKMLVTAKTAQLANDITESITAWEKQIVQGKVDFPDYDWGSAQEFVVDYWAGIKKNLTEDPSSYTDADLADLIDEFSEAKKQNFLVIAQCEIWSGDYNAKYFPVYQKISNTRVTLSEECPSVAETYIPQLDDLDGEMGSALTKLSEGEVESQEEFDKMLARVDEISKEVDKILEEAKAAEATATGINGVSVSEAVKAGKAYTIDGKQVSTAKNGLYIINGKKVVVKK